MRAAGVITSPVFICEYLIVRSLIYCSNFYSKTLGTNRVKLCKKMEVLFINFSGPRLKLCPIPDLGEG